MVFLGIHAQLNISSKSTECIYPYLLQPRLYASGKNLRGYHMLKLKVLAVIAAMFFISSVSIQAMEFADRPGPISTGLVTAAATKPPEGL
jgi:hypothetical protein